MKNLMNKAFCSDNGHFHSVLDFCLAWEQGQSRSTRPTLPRTSSQRLAALKEHKGSKTGGSSQIQVKFQKNFNSEWRQDQEVNHLFHDGEKKKERKFARAKSWSVVLISFSSTQFIDCV